MTPGLVEWMAWRRYLTATRASGSAMYPGTTTLRPGDRLLGDPVPGIERAINDTIDMLFGSTKTSFHDGIEIGGRSEVDFATAARSPPTALCFVVATISAETGAAPW